MFLEKAELLSGFYSQAANVDENDISLYLQRANAFCYGYIGGTPPTVDTTLKVAVALCFEIFARGETAQIDEDTGNITDAAPSSASVQADSRYGAKDKFITVKEMLRPYRLMFESKASLTDRSVKFL